MKVSKLDDYFRGWIIGDFEPSVLRTKDFEVGLLHHTKGEKWASHFHEVATEINVLVSGRMRISGIVIEAGDVFVFEPNEVANPVFLEDCTVLVIKTPSVIGDKYESIL